MYHYLRHMVYNFAGKTDKDMETDRIKAPNGVKKLMEELWWNNLSSNKQMPGRVFMVDLPEPTEEEKRIMAANRAARKPVILDENELQKLLDNALGKLGGW